MATSPRTYLNSVYMPAMSIKAHCQSKSSNVGTENPVSITAINDSFHISFTKNSAANVHPLKCDRFANKPREMWRKWRGTPVAVFGMLYPHAYAVSMIMQSKSKESNFHAGVKLIVLSHSISPLEQNRVSSCSSDAVNNNPFHSEILSALTPSGCLWEKPNKSSLLSDWKVLYITSTFKGFDGLFPGTSVQLRH